MNLVVCETVTMVMTHLRDITNVPPRYGGWGRGHITKPRALCDAEIAWDTRTPISEARCQVCRQRATTSANDSALYAEATQKMSGDIFMLVIERSKGLTLEAAFLGFCEHCDNSQHRAARSDIPRHLALSYSNALVQVISVQGVGFTRVNSYSAIGVIGAAILERRSVLKDRPRRLEYPDWVIRISMAHGALSVHADWTLPTHPVIDISTNENAWTNSNAWSDIDDAMDKPTMTRGVRWLPVMNGDTYFGETAHLTDHIVEPA